MSEPDRETTTARLLHAWHSPSQERLLGTVGYRLSVTGEEVRCTEISESGAPRGWADARWLGVIDADTWTGMDARAEAMWKRRQNEWEFVKERYFE